MGSSFRGVDTVRPILARTFCVCNNTTGVFRHLFTDRKTIFATVYGLHVVPDTYPLKVKIRSNSTFGYIEDINDENDEVILPKTSLKGLILIIK